MGRYLEPSLDDAPLISGPEDVVAYLRAEIGGSAREQFHAAVPERRRKARSLPGHDEGTVDAAHVYPREVHQEALDHNATALILVHNHPSGTLKASEQDMDLTSRLTEICSQVGISLHDHLIATRNGVYSISSSRAWRPRKRVLCKELTMEDKKTDPYK
jgi:DNA repair protein RadC